MITVLTGDNSFELARALTAIRADFAGVAEQYDGDELELSQLPDLLQGGTLFATERLVIIKNLTDNKKLWDVLPDWLEKTDDDTHVVLVEPKLDKRTRTYKELKKHATLREFSPWGDRDVIAAETWTVQEAKRQGVTLDKKLVQQLVARVGLDQWQLYHALEKLAVLEQVDATTIENTLEAQPSENVFNLLDAALNGKTERVHTMIQNLQRSQDPYMTFGLLSGQVFQLAALSVADKSSGEVAGDIGAHPYALGKLAPYAKKLGRPRAKKIVTIFADADNAMKSTAIDPWLLVEESLVKTASA